MECYKLESEFIDSLDFLSPPVKRIHNSRNEFIGPVYKSGINNVQVFKRRDKHTKSYEKLLLPKRSVKIGAESSESLTLKRTSERRILERYSVLSYTSLQRSSLNQSQSIKRCQGFKSKPLIKVTVIPKTEQTQTPKLLGKRWRHTPKRVQNALSNHENSIQTKNVYLVVAGRSKDKIYEIKTTASATFTSDVKDRHDDISLKELTYLKQLIMNMDQESSDPKTNERQTFPNYNNDLYRSESPSNRSRVRIFGQLGLSNDDRYVLRYGASINDKRVSDFTQLPNDILPASNCLRGVVTACEHNTEYKKDVSVQADHEENYEYQKLTIPYFSFGNSLGTQVNFNDQVPTKKRHGRTHLKTVNRNTQCSCNNTRGNTDIQKYIRDCQSPLVIISVYPKQSPEDITGKSAKLLVGNKSNLSPRRTQPKQVPIEKEEKSTGKQTERKQGSKRDKTKPHKLEEPKKENIRVTSSRSPSPVKFPGIKTYENCVEARVLNTQINKKTSERTKGNRVLEKSKQKTEPRSSFKYNSPNSQLVHKKTFIAPKRTPRFDEKGTNTEHSKAKMILVDNYTKKLTEQRNQKDETNSKLNNSKVRINIDAEHEFYNVLFDHGKLTTDLKIKKTLKSFGCNKGCGNMKTSLENLFAIPEKETTIHPKSTALHKQFDDSPAIERISGLAVRDSLEISHRRENKNYVNMKNTQTCYTVTGGCNESQFLAPLKHYIGDDCSICDPIERDKEIRELLGVDKSQAHSSADDIPYSCFHQRGKNHVAQINLVNLYPCLQTPNIEDTEDSTLLVPLDGEQTSTYWDRQHKVVTENISYFELSNYLPYQKPVATEKQHQQQLQQQKLLQQQQQQKQALQLQQHKQLRIQQHRQHDHKTECVGCSQCTNRKNRPNSNDNIKNDDDCYDCGPMQRKVENSAIYQQLILNRNMQVFIQVKQFSKHKSLALSRKQYDKMKKIIQSAIHLSKNKRRNITVKSNGSNLSVGEVSKTNNTKLQECINEEVQTVLDLKYMCHRGTRGNRTKTKMRYSSSKLRRNRPGRYNKSIENNSSNNKTLGNINDTLEQNLRINRAYEKPLGVNGIYCVHVADHRKYVETDGGYAKYDSQYEMPQSLSAAHDLRNKSSIQFEYRCREGEQKSTITLYNANKKYIEDHTVIPTVKSLSSMEILCYTSMAYIMGHTDLSASDIAIPSDSNVGHVQSLETIFRGYRKSLTPNLGTSIYSLFSEGYRLEKSTKSIIEPKPEKSIKRPFLRRLMSCLVMQSSRTSELKLPTTSVQEISNVNSSVDSYHISTFLGGVEASSSIYDTSASFYSNHTILPINSKIKRGFFSSVKGFLTNRKAKEAL